MSDAVTTRGLTKRYGSFTALESLDLTVGAGSIEGLIGANGAGKTTTLRLLLDLLRPTRGTVLVLGDDPRTAGPALRRRIGYIPGALRLDGRAHGRTMLDHFAEISGPVPPGSIDALAERLDADLGRPLRSLSKGNKQKIGIIQAFMHRPELLVLDEPTTGLDPLAQREFLEMVREASNKGQTVLLSSHILSEVQHVADNVTILSAGRVVADNTVASLRLAQVRHVRASIDGVAASELRLELSSTPSLSSLDLSGTRPAHLTVTVDGDIDPLIKVLARHHVLELTVEEPDLEESVLRLYAPQGADLPSRRHE